MPDPVVYPISAPGIEALIDQTEKLAKAALDADQAFSALQEKGIKPTIVNLGKVAKAAKEVDEGQRLINKAFSQGATPMQRLVDLRTELIAKTTQQQQAEEKFGTALQRINLKIEEAENRIQQNKGRTLSMLFDEQNALLKTSEHYDTQKRKLAAIEDVLEGLHLPGSSLVTTFKKIADAQGEMAETGTEAEQAMLKQAIAIGGVVAVAGAAAIGVAALTAAEVVAIQHTREWNDELAKAGMGLDQGIVDRADDAVAALDTLELSGKRLAGTMASTFASSVKRGSIELSALALAAADAWTAIVGDGSQEKATRGTVEITASMLGLGGVYKDYTKQAREAAAAQEDLTRRQREGNTVAKMLELHGGPHGKDAVESLREYKRTLEETQRAEEETARAQQKAGERRKKDLAQQSALYRQFMADQEAEDAVLLDQQLTGYQAEWDWEQKLQELQRQGFDDQAQMYQAEWDYEQKIRDAQAKAQEDRKRHTQELGDFWEGAASQAASAFGRLSAMERDAAEQTYDQIHDLQAQRAAATTRAEKEALDARIARLKQTANEEQRAAKTTFELQKGANLVGAAMSGGEAVLKGYAIAGPAGAIAAGVLAAAEIAFIAAQKPPTFGSSASAPPMSVTASSTPSIGGGTPNAGGTGQIGEVPMSAPRGYAPQVGDAYYGPTAGSQVFKTTPGDVVSVEKAGVAKKEDARALSLMQQQLMATRDQTRALDRVADLLIARRHFEAVVGPSQRV